MEHLIAHIDWIRDLARALTADDATADDVVQETWLAVLRRPPRDVDNPRGFLGTIVRNVVRQRDRGERRRRSREQRSARDDALPDGTALLERAEIHRKLVNALMHVREPSRTALLLRYFDDRPPREIAAALGVPIETVRARLKRGLAQLRAQLDDRFEGGRRAWIAAVAMLATKPAPAAVGGGTLTGLKGAIAAAALVALTTVSVPTILEEHEADAPDLRASAAPKSTEDAPDRPTPPLRLAHDATAPATADAPSTTTTSDAPAPTTAAQPALRRTAAKASGSAKRAAKRAKPRRQRSPKRPVRAPLRDTIRLPDDDIAALARASHPVLRPAKDASTASRKKAREALQATIQRIHAKRAVDPLASPESWRAVFAHPAFTPKGRYPKLAAGRHERAAGALLDVPKGYDPRRPTPLLVTRPFEGEHRFEHGPHPRSIVLQLPRSTHLGRFVDDLRIDRMILLLDGPDDPGWPLAMNATWTCAGIVLRNATVPDGFRAADFRNTPFLLLDEPRDRALRRDLRAAGVRFRTGPTAPDDLVANHIVQFAYRNAPEPDPTWIDHAIHVGRKCVEHWVTALAVKEPAERPHFSIWIERSRNAIHIESTGVEGFVLALNDRLVDLDHPIEVIVNGERRREFGQRSLETMIENWPRSMLLTIHPATIAIDVPRDR